MELNQNITTLRGMSLNKNDALLKSLSSLEPGDSFLDKAYLSTTTSKKAPDWFTSKSPNNKQVIIKMNIPKGSKGLFLKSVSHTPEENEFLLPRNSKFNVVSKKVLNDGNIELEFDLL